MSRLHRLARSLRSSRFVLPALVLGAVFLVDFDKPAQSQETPKKPLAEQELTHVEAETCVLCHRTHHHLWDTSRHSKMVRPASVEGVIGDFSVKSVKLGGDRYNLKAGEDGYYISESYLTGKKVERKIDYTLGNRRIQHYLTTLEDGRIVVLPPSWDNMKKEWFHNLEIVGMPNPDQGRAVQVWNKNCFGCHVSQQTKTYDVEEKAYTNSWIDFGANCDRCHGPGSRHVERYTRRSLYKEDPNSYIVTQTKLDNVRDSMVCAQCHSFRDIMAPGFTAGEDYFDYFLPLLEYAQEENSAEPVWYVDGRTRRFSTNGLAFWQSECFLKGKAACTTCHNDSHRLEIEQNDQLLPTNSGLCTGCHAEIAKDITAHAHHQPTSTGSSCVECHMPKTVVSIKTEMRDHSITVPTPENTVRFGVPNACNLCHDDKSADWAVETMRAWYPGSTARQKLMTRADVFFRARKRDKTVLERLYLLADNKDESPLARANALGYLDRFPTDPRVIPALLRATTDEHPMVRATAMSRLGQIEGVDLARVQPALVTALGDPSRIVRMNACLSLMNLGVPTLEGKAGGLLESAKRDSTIRATLYPDDPDAQRNLGMFHILNRDADGAADAFWASSQIAPDQPGILYFLALARLGQERYDDAKDLLKKVDKKDPYRPHARALLKKLKD